jgi:hypothetical protein
MTIDLKKNQLLKQELDLMRRAAKVLEKSWKECQGFGDHTSYPIEQIKGSNCILKNMLHHSYGMGDYDIRCKGVVQREF